MNKAVFKTMNFQKNFETYNTILKNIVFCANLKTDFLQIEIVSKYSLLLKCDSTKRLLCAVLMRLRETQNWTHNKTTT